MVYSVVCALACALAVVTFSSFTILDLGKAETSRSAANMAHGAETEASQRQRVGRALQSVLVFGIGAALAMGLLFGVVASRLVLAPLRDLARVTDELRMDPMAEDEVLADEVHAVSRAFRKSLRQVREEQRALAARSDELARAQAQLAHADKLASIGRVAAGVAHDIGNPLAAVLGYLRIIQMSDSAEERNAVVARCLTELGRIHGTIKDMLAHARSDAGDSDSFDLFQVLRDTTELLRAHAALDGVELQVAPPTITPTPAVGSAETMGRILMNLVVNAAHAVAEGPRKLIVVRLHEDDDGYLVTVEDSGPGITADIRARVFEPFFTTKRSGAGTGLGLTLVRTSIEAMGGSIHVSDSELGGVTFRVRVKSRRPNLSPSQT